MKIVSNFKNSNFENCLNHIPVLLNEVLKVLDPKPYENFIDCTFGWGGHSRAILEKTAPRGKVLGIEWDSQSLAKLWRENWLDPRLAIENDSYVKVAAIAKRHDFNDVSGILFDFGMSSWHIDQSGKGFAFSKDEPLDMRYQKSQELTAAKIVNEFSRAELEKIFFEYGQEKKAKKLAAAIVKARTAKPIETTWQLTKTAEKHIDPRRKNQSLARIFQALRIAVNDELGNIKTGIEQGFEIMAKGGRMAAITFHSLEDAIVKNKFKELAASGRAIAICKKPIMAGAAEVEKNSRARSAKLRAILKIS